MSVGNYSPKPTHRIRRGRHSVCKVILNTTHVSLRTSQVGSLRTSQVDPCKPELTADHHIGRLIQVLGFPSMPTLILPIVSRRRQSRLSNRKGHSLHHRLCYSFSTIAVNWLNTSSLLTTPMEIHIPPSTPSTYSASLLNGTHTTFLRASPESIMGGRMERNYPEQIPLFILQACWSSRFYTAPQHTNPQLALSREMGIQSITYYSWTMCTVMSKSLKWATNIWP